MSTMSASGPAALVVASAGHAAPSGCPRKAALGAVHAVIAMSTRGHRGCGSARRSASVCRNCSRNAWGKSCKNGRVCMSSMCQRSSAGSGGSNFSRSQRIRHNCSSISSKWFRGSLSTNHLGSFIHKLVNRSRACACIRCSITCNGMRWDATYPAQKLKDNLSTTLPSHAQSDHAIWEEEPRNHSASRGTCKVMLQQQVFDLVPGVNSDKAMIPAWMHAAQAAR
mmetsp:Transcript_86730/g.250298  ORF Transcript_86730/g.250298 Transcript_86730/m.250298 type:complete len:224 (+) Transcript_86730:395-1066(+)